MSVLQLDPNSCYYAAPVVGLMVGEPLAIGMHGECHLIRASHLEANTRQGLLSALARSLQSWGFDLGLM